MPRFSIQSPNGRVKLTVTLREGALHYTAEKDGFAATDDASLAEHIGIGVYLVDCGAENFKVTVGSDLSRAEILLKEREETQHAHRTGI